MMSLAEEYEHIRRGWALVKRIRRAAWQEDDPVAVVLLDRIIARAELRFGEIARSFKEE